MLPPICARDPLAVERALELLEGPQGRMLDWYHLNELRALKVAEEESLQRVTVSQETDPSRKGVSFRRTRARLAQAAATIPGQKPAWPTPLADLTPGFRYRWTAADPHSNVEPLTGGSTAAFVYLGEEPERDRLENVYAGLRKARRHAVFSAARADVDASGALATAEDRLCIVYKENHTLRFYRPSGYASITDPAPELPDDIAGEER
jgi:hypothetical protein